jgi:uncharacterized protein YbaR (Trm112 family)
VNLDPDLRAIIRCPQCRGELTDASHQEGQEETDELVCPVCSLAYPVREDIPVLLVDEARATG